MTDTGSSTPHGAPAGDEFGIGKRSQEVSEQRMIAATQSAYTMWGSGLEIFKYAIEEWVTRRQANILRLLKDVGEVGKLESVDARAAAMTQIARNQIETALQDFSEATYKAIAYAGGYADRVKDGMERMQDPERDQRK